MIITEKKDEYRRLLAWGIKIINNIIIHQDFDGTRIGKDDAKMIKELGTDIWKYLTTFALTINKDDLLSFGFKPWDETSDIYLIPYFLRTTIPANWKFYGIDEKPFISKAGGAGEDDDIRLGVLAYGIKIGDFIEAKPDEKN
jgi:hypothetical protein